MAKWALVLASGAVLCSSGKAQEACCSSDLDCTSKMSTADIDYNSQYSKTLECDLGCPGLIHCNMFGICEQCRGCFETCDGAAKYMAETLAPAEVITFCSGVGVSDMSECDGDGAFGEGSGSASVSYGSAASVSGMGSGSASGGVTAGYASGEGSGSGTASSIGMATASGSGMNSASGEVTAGYASGADSGSASIGMATASGSGDNSRIADIDGCDCDSEGDAGSAEYLCTNEKSMYCDLECIGGVNPADALLPDMGGLWCQGNVEGCRMCKFDCTDYEGGCVPCPAGVKNWC